ncbi:MAG: hypothetical protein IJB80_05755 [Clostridia bacterium]|nr:hypothetical protein [Clostridia bacterium]
MKKTLVLIWQESFFCQCLVWLTRKLRLTLTSSFLWKVWRWMDTHIIQSRWVQAILDPKHLTNAYYASTFYKKGTLWIRRLSFVTPKPSLPWNSLAISAFLAVVLLIPESFCSATFLFGAFLTVAIFYFAHHRLMRTGMVFAMVCLLLTIFGVLFALALPSSAAKTLSYLLLGVCFFFLISFAIRTAEDFVKALRCIYLLLLLLCALGFFQQEVFGSTARATFLDSVTFGEVMVLLFPFAFIAPMTFSSTPRRIAYLIPLLMLTFSAVTATQSRAAFIGFSAELLLLILLFDWRYLPMLLFLAPAMTGTAIENIVAMWDVPKSYGNFFINLISAFRQVWSNGFGIRRGVFLDFYSNALTAETGPLAVSPLYFSFLLELGMLGLLFFLWYLLRLAHSTLTSIFTAKKEFRGFFVAGFAMLIGISVSSLLEASLFSPRIFLLYWGMLGLLRAARIIRFGIVH